MNGDPIDRLLDAALPHVPFDGWSAAAFAAAMAESGVDPALARALCPRGALDLAVAFHRRGDRAMVGRLEAADLGALRFRDRIALAVRSRLEAAGDPEIVRRGAALFALPLHAPEGAKLIWETADHIWNALGDTSQDFNWYTKRATLSAVYGSALLYWLGDTSPGHAATWEFVDRRIEDVMRIEGWKKAARENPVLSRLMAGPAWLAERVKAPDLGRLSGLPGRFRGE